MLGSSIDLLKGVFRTEGDNSVACFSPTAAQNGHESVVTMLLEAGAKPCAVDVAKMTALHHSCLASSEECVRVLLASGSEAAVDAADMSGCTPLLYCLNNKNASVERLLVSHGASLTKALDAGFSELCYHTYTES